MYSWSRISKELPIFETLLEDLRFIFWTALFVTFCEEVIMFDNLTFCENKMAVMTQSGHFVLTKYEIIQLSDFLMKRNIILKYSTDLLVKVYIEDAIGERVWVDHPDCKGFVENICTAFDTKMPSSNLFFSQASKPPSDSASGPGRESPGPGSGQGIY